MDMKDDNEMQKVLVQNLKRGKNLRRKKSKSCFSCPYIYIRPAFPILLFDRSKSLNYWHCWNKNPKLSKESVDKKLLVIASYLKFVKFLRKKYKF